MSKRTNIMAFGDSITYGIGDFEHGGWLNRLRLYYDKKYEYDYRVYNFGVSGEISEEVLNRFEIECNARYEKEGHTIIIFAIGINDTQVVEGNERVSIEGFEGNIKELIKRGRKFTNEMLFVGLTNVDEERVVPLPWNKGKSYFNEKIEKFDHSLETICNNEQVSYVKMYGLLSTKELADGVHPDEIGHQKMCDKVLKKINSIKAN